MENVYEFNTTDGRRFLFVAKLHSEAKRYQLVVFISSDSQYYINSYEQFSSYHRHLNLFYESYFQSY